VAALQTFYLQDFFGYMFVLARFGGFFTISPIFSEKRINPRLRLMLALTLTVVIAPSVSEYLPKNMPGQNGAFDLMLAGEILIGLFAGLIARVLLTALDIAGSLIGFQMSLANAFTNSPATAQQAGLPAAFLTMIGVTLIFATGFHQVMIKSIIYSYEVFQPGAFESLSVISADMAQTLVRFLGAAFLLGLQVAAPVTILGLTMLASAGIINRLMPQIQVFFILQPFQILLGFITLTLSLVIVISYFIQDFADKYSSLWNQG